MASRNIDVLAYVHSDPYVDSLLKFLMEPTCIVYGWNIKDLLKYEIINTLGEKYTNLDLIFQGYPLEMQSNKALIEAYEKDKENLSNPNYDGEFKITNLYKGTHLVLPRSHWNFNVVVSEGNIVKGEDYNVFFDKKMLELIQDPKYYPIGKVELGDNINIIKNHSPKQTVWMWCKGLSKPVKGGVEELKGGIINLSPFIKSLNTTNTPDGASWSIELPPLMCEWSDADGWILKDKINYFTNNGEENFTYQGNFHNLRNKEKRNQFYFNNIIKENDIIFIRFETLNNELPDRLKDSKRFFINSSDLSDKIYDLIGLVDNNRSSINFSSKVNINISISGRDLTKLIIEDGCFFYPGDFIDGGIVANHSRSQELFRYEGKLHSLTQTAEKSIEYCMKFIFNSLCNTEIAPDELFKSFKDRTRRFDLSLSASETEKDFYLKEKKEKIINDIKKVQDSVIIEESDLSTPENLFNIWYDYINKNNTQDSYVSNVVQLGDDSFSISLPKEVIKNLGGKQEAININYDIEQYYNEMHSNEETKGIDKGNFTYAKGIWQIINVLIDDSIKDRRLVDSSIGNEMGSIINYIQKVCQEPFVEFFTETLGDKFNFIVRKPPFDKKSIVEYINKTLNGNINSTIIKGEDVISEDLFISSNRSYSWYRIIPQGNFPGTSSSIVFAFIKALHFPEYAKYFGEKPLEVVCNYISSFYPSGVKENNLLNEMITQVAYDLKYIVETNCYLPFTREGQIVLAGGDRRIKRGHWYYYELTNEIFYVDSVINTYSQGGKIERKTILNVSRGMVKDFILGRNIEGIGKVSYFNIINSIDESLELKYEEIVLEEDKTDKIPSPNYETPIPDTSPKQFIIEENPIELSSEEFELVGGYSNEKTHKLSPSNQKIFDVMLSHSPQNKNEINKLIKFVSAVEKRGIRVEVFDGHRSYLTQKHIYETHKIAAKPGTGKHEKDLAIDMRIFVKYKSNNKTKIKRLSRDDSPAEWEKTGVPLLAKQMGINWGGEYKDCAHFSAGPPEKGNIAYAKKYGKNIKSTTPSNSLIKEKNLIEVKQLEKDFVSQESTSIIKKISMKDTFNKYYVNKRIFNFFLSGQQFRK